MEHLTENRRFGLSGPPASGLVAERQAVLGCYLPVSLVRFEVDKLADIWSDGEGPSMGTKSRSRDRACSAVVAVCTAILPVMANAQDAAIDRIEAIERQMRGVQSELQRLKHELGEAKRQLRQSRSEAQRAQEEAREAEERARQDSLKAAAAEPPVTQAVAPTLPSPASGGAPGWPPAGAGVPGVGSGSPQAQAAAAPPPAAASSEGVKVSMPEGRPTIATADGRLSLAIGGLVQFDMGGYFQNPNPNTQFPKLNEDRKSIV